MRRWDRRLGVRVGRRQSHPPGRFCRHVSAMNLKSHGAPGACNEIGEGRLTSMWKTSPPLQQTLGFWAGGDASKPSGRWLASLGISSSDPSLGSVAMAEAFGGATLGGDVPGSHDPPARYLPSSRGPDRFSCRPHHRTGLLSWLENMRIGGR